jgi:amidase
MRRVATYITLLDQYGTGPRLAVKDLIDIAGLPTTAGCKAVAEGAQPATADAPCLAGARAAGAVIVGKANLYELAFGASGRNPWYGTPVNPLDPALLPGGSSSGSAAAVGEGSADIAYGSDTGGSVRIPSAFCGLAGLKTTYGRVSLDGVWPLAPSFDTVGPIARDVAGLATAMALLEPGFVVVPRTTFRVGRIRPRAGETDPRIEAAVDAALAAAGIEVIEVDLPDWQEALVHCRALLESEAAAVNARLMADPASDGGISPETLARLNTGARFTAEQIAAGQAFRPRWRSRWDVLFTEVDAVALPTMAFFAPPITDERQHPFTQFTVPVNLAGLPAVALPVPSEHRLPASLQLVGPAGSEEQLLAYGAVVEDAAGYAVTT